MSKQPPSSSQAAPPNEGNKPPPFQTRTTLRKTYYQPSVYQFTCRGSLQIHNNTDEEKKGHDNYKRQQKQQEFNDKHADGVGAALRDMYTCKGIQTRLRHVVDFPLSRSKQEAVQWFEGSPAFSMHSSAHLNKNKDADGGNKQRNSSKAISSGGGLKGSSKKAADQENKSINSDNNKKKNEKQQTEEPEETHSSYGTTQVNVLTVREVPVMSPDEAQRSQMADPFGGFGNIAPAGMLNPFGSLFGGFFGAAGGSPFPSSMPNMMSGSRSVSSSTRMTRDENGKRVATTITKTTTVDEKGKKRVETETTVRHLDEGGRVETKKVVHVDGGEDASTSSSSNAAAGDGGSGSAKSNDKRRHTARSLSPRGFEDSDPSPFFQSPVPGAIVDPSKPPSPPEVAEIATNLLLGLAVTDGTSSDPDNPNQMVRKSNGSGGWRKTEYLFRLGRFIPPFMVVSQYYEDKEEEARRRKELTKEYNERRQRQKDNRWGKFGEKQRQEKSKKDSGEDGNAPESDGISNFPMPADFPIDTSRAEYYLQRLHTQMEKNASMMEIMLKQVFKPDFPQKVRHSGERILENMGPTAERTGKLMKDVWTMWVGSWGEGDDDDRGAGGRRR
eukprot:scaffold1572_cov141-Skeletonema_menzelii.AAC.3